MPDGRWDHGAITPSLSLSAWLCFGRSPRVCVIGTKPAAGIVRWENTCPQMPSESQDLVQGSEWRERRTKKGGETGIQIMTSQLFQCQRNSRPEFKVFAGGLKRPWLAEAWWCLECEASELWGPVAAAKAGGDRARLAPGTVLGPCQHSGRRGGCVPGAVSRDRMVCVDGQWWWHLHTWPCPVGITTFCSCHLSECYPFCGVVREANLSGKMTV